VQPQGKIVTNKIVPQMQFPGCRKALKYVYGLGSAPELAGRAYSVAPDYIITVNFCSDSPWTSKFMALEKFGKFREFFLLIYGHPVHVFNECV